MEEVNIFENLNGERQIINENNGGDFWKINKVTIDGGIKQWIEGADFPRRGMCSPEAMFACNQAKRIFVQSIKIASKWQFTLAILFSRDKLQFIRAYIDVVWKVMSPFIIKYEYLTPVAQEIQDLSYQFVLKLGLDELSAERFSKIFSHLIEYDDAYRFRVEDLFNETRKEFMAGHPILEVDRLILLAQSRDNPGTFSKFEKVGYLLCVALWIPSIRKAFIEIIEDSNFEKLQVDDTEMYWHCMREDYKFGGMSNEDRKAYMKFMGWNIPKASKI